MLGYLQHGLAFRRLRSLRRLKWVRLVQRRLEWALLVQRRPKGVLLAQSSSMLALVRRSDNLETLLRVSRTTRLTRGVVPHPGRVAKGVILLPARGLGSRTIRRPMKLRRLHIANTGTISRVTRNIFVMLLWLFCWTTS